MREQHVTFLSVTYPAMSILMFCISQSYHMMCISFMHVRMFVLVRLLRFCFDVVIGQMSHDSLPKVIDENITEVVRRISQLHQNSAVTESI